MPRVEFPRELSQVAAIQANMSTASLADLRIAIEKLTTLSGKTGEIAGSIFSSGVFEAAMQRADELNDREMALNHQICLLRQELGDLAIAKDRFTPEQIAEQLDALRQKIFSCGAPSTPCLARQLLEIEQQWSHIHFLFDFPIAEELNPDSFQSNLLSRLTHRIGELRSSEPKKAASLQQTLKRFQQQCQLAEEIYSGQRKASSLPAKMKLEVMQRLFGHFPDLTIEHIDRSTVAAAIMASLSEQMMDVDFDR